MKMIDVLAFALKEWPKGTSEFILGDETCTRDQWEAAVKARNSKKKEWNGEGLPPVGTVCNLKYQGFDQGVVEVLFCSKATAVCRNLEDGREQFGDTLEYEFRPIRTPEQIAAEDRSVAISDIINTIGWLNTQPGCHEAAGRLYDAGYRKQEPK